MSQKANVETKSKHSPGSMATSVAAAHAQWLMRQHARPVRGWLQIRHSFVPVGGQELAQLSLVAAESYQVGWVDREQRKRRHDRKKRGTACALAFMLCTKKAVVRARQRASTSATAIPCFGSTPRGAPVHSQLKVDRALIDKKLVGE